MPCVLTLIARVVVPSTMSAIVIVTQQDHVPGYRCVSSVFDCRNAMELLSKCALNNLILIAGVVAFLVVKVKLVKSSVSFAFGVGVHVYRYR